MTSFEAHVECHEGLGVVKLLGDLDIATSPKAKAQMCELLEQGIRDFLIDLSEVGHVDSTGLGCLVWIRKQVAEGGGRLLLVGQNPQFRKLLELTGLNSLFPMCDDLTQGRAQLESP